MWCFGIKCGLFPELLILGFLTLVSDRAVTSAAGADPSPLEIKLGVLIPAVSQKEDIPDKSRALMAMRIGLEKVRREGVVSGVDFVLNYRDSDCSEKLAPLHAMDMYYKNESHVFFGPMCTYATAPVARYSPFWDIPVITPGARAEGFGNKEEYRLLTRVGGSYSNTEEFVSEVLSKFSWREVGIIYHNYKKNQVLGDAETFFLCKPIYTQRERLTSKQPYNVPIDETDMENYDLGKILREASSRCRSKSHNVTSV